MSSDPDDGPADSKPAGTPLSVEIPVAVRAIAKRMSGLFDRDQELAEALNAAHQRLLDANGRLTSGLSAEALLGVYGPGGADLGLSGERPEVLLDDSPIAALEQVAQDIRVAHNDYQQVAEQRRQLAFDVGETNAELQSALGVLGVPPGQARAAHIDALAEGVLRPSGVRERS